MTQDQQRLTARTRRQTFGFLGLARDPSVRNGIFWGSTLISYFAVVASLAANADEVLLGAAWGVLAGLLAIANYFLPSYKEAGPRWAARIFGSVIPMLGVVAIIYARLIDPVGFANAMRGY
ncbi:MAG: hypothetical protein AAGG65_17595 [Pseudomonadota bacterium]